MSWLCVCGRPNNDGDCFRCNRKEVLARQEVKEKHNLTEAQYQKILKENNIK